MPILFHLILFLPIYFIGGLIAKIAGIFVNYAKDVDATAITHICSNQSLCSASVGIEPTFPPGKPPGTCYLGD